MAASLHTFQFALKLCENHYKKELIVYCKTCQEKICSSCIKEDHSTHDWDMITDILREKKRSLPEECKEIRTTQLHGLKEELSRFDRKIEEEEACLKQTTSTLNVSRQSYIDEINRLFDHRIDKCGQKSESTIQIYKDKREGLKQKVEYLETMTTALDKDINTLPDHDILDMEKEMRDELEKALSFSVDKYMCTQVFVPGKMDVQALENMIGELRSVSVEEMNDIDKDFHIISSIQAVSETNAWVMFYEDNYPKLIDREGTVLKSMKSPCIDDLIISNSGQFVLTNSLNQSLSVLTEVENAVRTWGTKPLHPTYISKTENDDILVTLRDGGDLYNLTPTSRRVVQRMSLTGKVLHTYEFREDGKTRLFTWPTRTAENKNTDICVVNHLSKNSGELIVLHTDGRIRFTYKGGGLKFKEFSPRDVDCDDKCRILLTEKNNRAIHMLNAEGMYLCTLCHYDKSSPFTISLYGSNLWCGFLGRKVKVLKYTI
ncbi:hypothetical protein FSP39_009077 [Pinctada imbricata]|uniref:B box-type domain-containing protein n=1 Tax=Pinctada imbricata TaxID=66713 RepID=A0AA89CA95_PINIB|nr:hypothetical protein FSP39_009077 [Pinctada imbricata]